MVNPIMVITGLIAAPNTAGMFLKKLKFYHKLMGNKEHYNKKVKFEINIYGNIN